MNRYLTAYCLSMVFLFFSCEAPHENPLDPENPEYPYGTLQGKIETAAYPSRALSNTYVKWGPTSTITYTNSSGRYKFTGIAAQDGWLFFQKEGYSIDSTQVIWGDSKYRELGFKLNSIPSLIEGSLISTVLNRTTSIQNYKINTHIEIEDEENDVDSLFLVNNKLDVKLALSNSSVAVYEDEFSVSDFNLSSIGDIIGKEFNVIAKDEDKEEFDVAVLTVKRIIQEPIELLAPLNSQSVKDTIEFKWTRFEPGYSFHYLLQVYVDITGATDLVFEKDDISSQDIIYETDVKLNPDNYYWLLWVIDEFGNRAVSSSKKFIVE